MSGELLQIKLYLPRPRPSLVPRPHLIATLNQGLHRKLTLISAPAGFGKTTLVAEWIAAGKRPSAWLSLDEGDSDPRRFLQYLVAALQTVDPALGQATTTTLQAPQLPAAQAVLTPLLNEIAAVPDPFILVLDDYHEVDARPVDELLTFMLDHLPPPLHLVITTREDPNLPLARLRARGQLTELRAADLRFTVEETAVFLNQIMGLALSAADITALEARTEGWVAGLQLASLSLRGQQAGRADFIRSFTGSDRFVLDYLMEEVLGQQPDHIQAFLLKTAVLAQLTGPLCDALTGDTDGQAILEALERANLFLVPLDNERRWYRYHHLFADLLRQQLRQRTAPGDIAALHIRASQWYEAHGRELEAFQHAVAADDVDRAARLIAGEGVPLYFRGEAVPVRQWFESLPAAEFEARPALWVTYASVLTLTGRVQDTIEEILQAAETALQNADPDDQTADLLGQIAANRAMVAVTRNEVETMITQSQRALALLDADNAPMRTTATWTLGYAYQVLGNRPAAREAYAESIAQSRKSGNLMTEIAATTCVGQIQEMENQTHQAARSFRHILQLVGDPPWPAACEACVGLGRIHYQWNDLDAAERYGQQGLELARGLENVDTPASAGIALACVKLARGDVAGAVATLAEVERFVQQHSFSHLDSEITTVRIQTYLQQGDLAAAARLAETQELPLSQARVHLAQGDPAATLAVLEPARQQAEAADLADMRLRVLVLQALAFYAAADNERALQTLSEALTMAMPGDMLRPFVDAGPLMAHLLYEALARGIEPAFVGQLLAAFPATELDLPRSSAPPDVEAGLIEPLSEREIEVLRLIAEGLSNQEIANRLYLSLHTIKAHARNIYSKLGVRNRTEAVATGRALGILAPV
jgi:LuxR family maltose regulon positive regulatory protein